LVCLRRIGNCRTVDTHTPFGARQKPTPCQCRGPTTRPSTLASPADRWEALARISDTARGGAGGWRDPQAHAWVTREQGGNDDPSIRHGGASSIGWPGWCPLDPGTLSEGSRETEIPPCMPVGAAMWGVMSGEEWLGRDWVERGIPAAPQDRSAPPWAHTPRGGSRTAPRRTPSCRRPAAGAPVPFAYCPYIPRGLNSTTL